MGKGNRIHMCVARKHGPQQGSRPALLMMICIPLPLIPGPSLGAALINLPKRRIMSVGRVVCVVGITPPFAHHTAHRYVG